MYKAAAVPGIICGVTEASNADASAEAGDDSAALLTLELPATVEAGAAARKALAALNGSLSLVSEARLQDGQLLVGELVSNAVRHGGPNASPVRVVVHADDSAMRVEVHDRGEGFDPEQLPPPHPDRVGNWGLPIVATLAHRWGVKRGNETVVWFEIDRPGRDIPLEARATRPE